MATKRKAPEDLLKRGRHTEYRPDFHNEDFLRLSREGKTIVQIASEWGLYKGTLFDWAKRHPEFANSMAIGAQYAEAHYINLGHAGGMLGMLKGKDGKPIKVDLGFFRLLTMNKFGWSDNSKNQVNGKLQVTSFADLVKELEKEEEDEPHT